MPVEVHGCGGSLVIAKDCPVINGIAYVPFREFFEAMGYAVDYDGHKAAATMNG
jgi:hypothetical protein